MTDAGKYIYCVIHLEREADFNLTGIEDGQQVYCIKYRDVAAVVSNTSQTICQSTHA